MRGLRPAAQSAQAMHPLVKAAAIHGVASAWQARHDCRARGSWAHPRRRDSGRRLRRTRRRRIPAATAGLLLRACAHAAGAAGHALLATGRARRSCRLHGRSRAHAVLAVLSALPAGSLREGAGEVSLPARHVHHAAHAVPRTKCGRRGVHVELHARHAILQKRGWMGWRRRRLGTRLEKERCML